MSKELIVSATRHETRVAILEDDQLVEIFHQREQEYSLAGSIHKGRVTRVLPGMQSAFVDIGLERDAFLYVSDFFEDNEEYDKIVSGVEEKVLKLEKGGSGAITLPTPIEPEMAAVLGAVPGALMATPQPPYQTTSQPTSQHPSNPTSQPAPAASAGSGASSNGTPAGADPQRRDNRDRDPRGGRGRRGRRRRPGAGGLPESKFFSPREGREGRENRPPTHSPAPEMSAEPEGGLIVLPGESISKYVGQQESGEPEETAAPEDLAAQEMASEVVREEHTEARVEAEEARVDEQAAAELAAHAQGEAAADVDASDEPLTEAAIASETEAILSRPEAGDDFETIEGLAPETDLDVPADGDTIDESDVELIIAETDSPEAFTIGETEEEGSGPAGIEGEGPEPARIPQSLTAALREQGGRLPHRVSRRMRRRMRGDRSPEQPAPGAEGASSVAAGAPASEEVKAPNEQRRQGGRGREERPREDRPREERPREDRPREDRPREERPREDRPREERAREERPREDRPREERPREDRPREDRARDEARPAAPSITDLLKSGQEIIVQIAKEPLGQKGARITSHIALPGRFLVYMPTVDHIGVSRKIPSDEERQRLKRVLQTNRTGIPGGFIVRTAGENRSEEELRADMMFLYTLWMDMRQKAEKKPAPFLLHHDLDVVERILRDQLTSAFKSVWVDNESVYESVLSFVQRFQPAMVSRIKLYTRPTPIFDEFGITQELEKALRPKVWLKSGGYIVINQTEALVAIDINTGKYVGKNNRLEDTIVKINTDAIKEIVRQIRLRDLGGIIVVDFIDMDERKNRQKVMQVLEESMRVDRAPYKILQFNDFGLVAITRKRVKQSLERTLCSPCPYCEGAAYVKSVHTVISEILQEAHKIAKAIDGDTVILRVNPEVAKVLKSNANDHLEEIESTLGKTVMIKSDPLLHQTKFDMG